MSFVMVGGNVFGQRKTSEFVELGGLSITISSSARSL